MFDIIAGRLAGLGYEISEDDAELISFCSKKVENDIKNRTNLADIPEGLREVFIDRVCGEVLMSKLMSGELDGGEGGVKSITEGDVSVSFSGGVSVRDLIDRLLASGRGELICYRKIRW